MRTSSLRTQLCSWVTWLCTATTLAQTTPAKAATHAVPSKSQAQQSPAPQLPVPQFEDVAQKAGPIVPDISPDKRSIVESMSGGIGLIECDNGGKLDIVNVNGSTVDRYPHGGDPLITLYHQDSDLQFTDITKSAGLTRKGCADFIYPVVEGEGISRKTALPPVSQAGWQARTGGVTKK